MHSAMPKLAHAKGDISSMVAPICFCFVQSKRLLRRVEWKGRLGVAYVKGFTTASKEHV